MKDTSGKFTGVEETFTAILLLGMFVLLVVGFAQVGLTTGDWEGAWNSASSKFMRRLDKIWQGAQDLWQNASKDKAKNKSEPQADPGYDFGGSQNKELDETGEANTYQEKRDEETGQLLQRRYYGDDGRASYDTDYAHSGEHNHEFPHDHYWDWSDPKNPVRNPGVTR